jgi:acetyl-CoA acetyltransferase
VRQVDVVGVGITPFGKHADATVRSLGADAIGMALADAGLAAADVGLLVHGNAMAGVLEGQEMVRGQLVAASAGLAGVPVVNVENACATSSSAMHVALAGIRAGMYDTAVVCGTEKMTGRPTAEILAAMTGGADLSRLAEITADLTGSDQPAGSFFMAVYARIAAEYQARAGATAEDFADVAVKNEAVTAFVAARPGEHVDPDEIRKMVRELKGSHQTPKAIHVVDELPKTAAGKIDKKALRRPYWPEGTRQIH